MKKNETTQVEEEKKLVWKLKDLPTADAVSKLVETKVITSDEARAILFREEVKQSDEVEALKEMVKVLQEMVKDILSRQSSVTLVPYTKVIQVPANYNPYWNKFWNTGTVTIDSTSLSSLSSTAVGTGISSSAGYNSYTVSI